MLENHRKINISKIYRLFDPHRSKFFVRNENTKFSAITSAGVDVLNDAEKPEKNQFSVNQKHQPEEMQEKWENGLSITANIKRMVEYQNNCLYLMMGLSGT